MTRATALPLPNWPNLMDAATAAAYLAIGESSFRALAARAGVLPVELGLQVTRWRRSDIDAMVANLAVRGVEITDDTANAPDAAEEALARVRQRLEK